MDTIRRSHPLSLVLVLALLASGAAWAAAGEAGLYDQPVLTLDPGMHTATIWRADVSATGAYAVTGSDDKTVRLWDAPDGAAAAHHPPAAGAGACGPGLRRRHQPRRGARGGGRVYRGSGPAKVHLPLRTATPGPSSGASTACPKSSCTWPSRPRAATWRRRWGARSGLRVYDRDTGWREVARDAAYGDASYGAAFAADGRLATTSYDGTLRLYDGAFRRVATAKTTDGTRPLWPRLQPRGRPAGRRLCTTRRPSRSSTGTPSRRCPARTRAGIDNGDLMSVAWSADGATLYAGGRYWRAGTNPVVAWSQAGAGPRRELGRRHQLRHEPAAAAGRRAAGRGGGPLARGAGRGRGAALGACGRPRPICGARRGRCASPPTAAWSTSATSIGGRPRPASTWRGWRSRSNPPADGQTRPPEQATLKVEHWADTSSPPDARRHAAGAGAV